MNTTWIFKTGLSFTVLLILLTTAAIATAEQDMTTDRRTVPTRDVSDEPIPSPSQTFTERGIPNLGDGLDHIDTDPPAVDNTIYPVPPDIEKLFKGTATTDRAVPERYGSDHMKRTIIVHDDRSTYYDEMLYTAAVPAAVHWENSTRHSSLLAFDTPNRDLGILHGDWAGYLEQIGGAEHLDFLGPVPAGRQMEISGYYDDPADTETVTEAASLYNASADMAAYYWGTERTRNVGTAIIAYAPESDGGVQVENVHTNASSVAEYYNVTLKAADTAWLSANLEWDDPNDNSVYDVSMKDPYSTHHSSYNTSSNWYQANPSNNLVFDHEGSREAGLSPMYSVMPFMDNPQVGRANFSDTVGATDGSGVPEAPFNDCVTHTIGPVQKGDLVEAVLSWPGASVLEIYVHPHGTTADQYLFWGWWNQPQICRFPSDRTDLWDITVHTFEGNGDTYELNVTWGCVPEKSWHVHQFQASDNQYTINVSETRPIDVEVSESATNAAVLASMMDAPMLYTAGGIPEECLMDAIGLLGIRDVVLVDPAGMIDPGAWDEPGLSVTHLSNDSAVFNTVAEMGYGKTGERDVVVPALGGPWFAAAALSGAAHAAPVPAPNDPLVLSATNLSTIVWWDMIERAVKLGGSAMDENTVPTRADMETMADHFYSWLGGFHPDFDPDCNDADADGIPDQGGAWNYSADVDVVMVSPMNGIKMCLDRAIIGKGSVGRIPEPDPAVCTAIAARAALYWEVAFSPGANPEDPTAVPENTGFWDRAGWTFVAYTHDDGIMDDDLGDDTDDDYCGENDGGANHLAYYMSEELPQYATDHGVGSNEYNTDYANVLNMLEDGLGVYVHADHGSYNLRMETGAGGLGLSTKANPWRDWNDGASVDDPDGAGNSMGLSNPSSLDYVSGWDLYCSLHDLPSTLIYLQDCQVGGSHMPGILLRMGSAGVVGDHYSMAIDPSPVYNDRLMKGLLTGMDYGQANRWAVDEASAVYSMHDPSPPDGGGGAALGYSVQCTLYGDPEIVLARPTLRPQLTWEFPENGTGKLTFNVLVLDQDGNPYPCTPNASVDGETLNECGDELGPGLFAFNWSVDGRDGGVLTLLLCETGYHDREYNDIIRTDFSIDIPTISGSILDTTYTGGFTQELNMSLEAFFETRVSGIINDTEACLARADIFTNNGTYTGIGSELVFTGSGWEYGENISSLPSGDYYVEVTVGVPYYPPLKLRSGDFTVSHLIRVGSPDVVYVGGLVQNYSITGVTAAGSRLGTLDGDDVTEASFRVTNDIGTPRGPSIPLEYTGSSWEAKNVSASGLLTGMYRVKVNISDGDVLGTSLSHLWSVEHVMEISPAVVSYHGPGDMRLDITNVSVMSTSGGYGPVDPTTVIISNYDVIDLSTDGPVLYGVLEPVGGEWEAKDVDASRIPSGTFLVRCTFTVVGEGPVSSDSAHFHVEHALHLSEEPRVLYRGAFIQQIDVENATVGSGYNGSLFEGNISVTGARYEILYENGTVTGIFSPLVEGNRNWHARGVDVSALPRGLYVVSCQFEALGAAGIDFKAGNFTVSHQMRFADIGLAVYDAAGKELGIENVKVECSWSGMVRDTVEVGYKIFDGEGKLVGIEGTLLSSDGQSFSARGIDVSELAAGDYRIRLQAAAGNLSKGVDTFGPSLSVGVEILIGELEIKVSDGVIRRTSIEINSNIAGMEKPGAEDMVNFTFEILHSNGTATGISGDLNWSDGGWWLPETDVTGLDPGKYKMLLRALFTDGRSTEKESSPFTLGDGGSGDDDAEGGDDDTGGGGDDDERGKDDEGLLNRVKNASNLIIAIFIGSLILIVIIVTFAFVARRRKRAAEVAAGKAKGTKDDDRPFDDEDEDNNDIDVSGPKEIWLGEDDEMKFEVDELPVMTASGRRRRRGRYGGDDDILVRGRYSEEVGEDGWLDIDEEDDDHYDDDEEEYGEEDDVEEYDDDVEEYDDDDEEWGRYEDDDEYDDYDDDREEDYDSRGYGAAYDEYEDDFYDDEYEDDDDDDDDEYDDDYYEEEEEEIEDILPAHHISPL